MTIKECPFCGSKRVFLLWIRDHEGHDFRCEDCKKTFNPPVKPEGKKSLTSVREDPMDFCAACYCAKVYCRGCKGYHCKCSWTGRGCRTWFRKHLNETCAGYKHKHKRGCQRVRPYGDYLYAQDREKFEYEFKEWMARTVVTG